MDILPHICVKRIAKDVSELNKNPLTDNGIFYTHDEENILNGYAMIIGPKDTLYENGFYFFTFIFPKNYPIEPPKVEFNTFDNKNNTRFHPNLYRNGKVCLSLINTWKGEGWTSCQTIRSVLLTLSSILTANPLLEEPGVTLSHSDNKPYNQIITFKNFEISILECLKFNNGDFNIFNYIIKAFYEKNKESIIDKIKKNIIYNNRYVSAPIYSMNCILKYEELLNNLNKIDLVK